MVPCLYLHRFGVDETMGDSIESLLVTVESKAQEIEAASDGLNEILEQIEDRLAQAQVGLTIEGVSMDDSDCELGYGKVGSKWVLTFREAEAKAPSNANPSHPLLKASRRIRQKSLVVIPELLRRVVARQDELLTSLKGSNVR